MRVYGIVSVGMLLPSDILYIRIQTIRLICYKCMTVFLVHIVHLRVCVHMCTSFSLCVCVCVHVYHVSCSVFCTHVHSQCVCVLHGLSFVHMCVSFVCE
jgi:hypothetical protein